jgi:pimeloyl-ACP methyl ester carboxylesterase
MGELNVRASGDPGARTFVWGHGLTSSMAAEDDAPLLDLDAVAGDGWRVVRYDARGHGDSPGPRRADAYVWEQLARDQLALLDSLGADRAVLGGASMGAATALWSTVLAPERVDALVLVIPPTAWATRAAQVRTYKAGAALLSAPGGDVVFARAARLAPAPRIMRDELAGMGAAMSSHVADIERRRLAAVLRGAARSDLPAPTAITEAAGTKPVLVLAWDTDPGHPVATADALAAALPQAEVHVAREPREVLAWTATSRAFLGRLDRLPTGR